MAPRRWLLFLAVCCLTACGTPTEPRESTLAAGRWAGGGACLSVAESGCDFVVGCAHGRFSVPTIRRDGTFDVEGTYRIEVGPVSMNPPPPAHFSGSLVGSTLTLTIVPSTPTPPAATYSMQLGAPGNCAVPCV